MKGLVLTADKEMSVKDFERPLYKTVGKVVNGSIEFVRPRGLPDPYCIIVDEEFLYKPNLKMNTVASYLYETHIHGWPILGTVVFMKEAMTEEGPDVVGLDDKDIEFLEFTIKNLIKKGI